MAKSFKSLVAKTGNKKTAAIANKRTKELLKGYKKYYILLKCEYEEAPAGYDSKYWFQFLEEWDADTEEFNYCVGEDNFFILMTNPRLYARKPFYFDSKKEAIKTIKIIRVYDIANDVKLDPDDEKIKKATYYVCSTTSDRKEKV